MYAEAEDDTRCDAVVFPSEGWAGNIVYSSSNTTTEEEGWMDNSVYARSGDDDNI